MPTRSASFLRPTSSATPSTVRMRQKRRPSRSHTSLVNSSWYKEQNAMEQLGRTLLIIGGVIILVGLFLTFGPRLPFRLGRLPLDIHVQRDNFNFYFPLGTS